MTYESTGEVRKPQTGDYYLNSNEYPEDKRIVTPASGGPGCYRQKEVIMRPVKPPIKCWAVVVPFTNREEDTRLCNKEIQALGWATKVKEIEL